MGVYMYTFHASTTTVLFSFFFYLCAWTEVVQSIRNTTAEEEEEEEEDEERWMRKCTVPLSLSYQHTHVVECALYNRTCLRRRVCVEDGPILR